MAPYIGYDSDTTFIPGTLNTSSSLFIQGGGITQTGGDVSFDSGTLFIDEDVNVVSIRTTTPPVADIALLIEGNAGVTSGDYFSFRAEYGNVDEPFAHAIKYDSVLTGLQYYGYGGHAFLTGGQERVRITSTGNVGIGTTNPSQKLHVIGAALITLDIQLTGSNPRIDFNSNGSSALRFWDTANNIERARIDTSGRLLVGTSTSPSAINGSSSLLIVQGQAGSSSAGGYVSIQKGEPATNITTNEEIGAVNFGDNAGNIFAYIRCRADAAAGAADYPGRLEFSTTADGAASPTERMRITKDGNVGIGTTNPQSKLHVYSGILAVGSDPTVNGAIGRIEINDDGSASGLAIYDSSVGGSSFRIFRDGDVGYLNRGGSINALSIDASGNVGIGAIPETSLTPDTKQLKVGGLTYIRGTNGTTGKQNFFTGILYNAAPTSSQADKAIVSNASSDFLPAQYAMYQGAHRWRNATSATAGEAITWVDQMIINNVGNVGIGTANPVNKLQVHSSLSPTTTTLFSVGSASSGRGSITFNMSDSTGGGDIIQHVKEGYISKNTYGLIISSSGTLSGSFTGAGPASIRFYYPSAGGGSQAGGQLEFWTRQNGFSGGYVEEKRMIIDNYGNVGIGATTPQGKLSIWQETGSILKFRKASDFDSNFVGHAIDSRNEANTVSTTLLYRGSPHIWWGDAGVNEIVRFTGTGNVGIGTTNPSQKLDVNGSIISNKLILRDEVTTVGGSSANYANSILTIGDNSGPFILFDTNEIQQFNTSMNLRGEEGYKFYTGDADDSNTVEVLNILQNGNVGIGTTNPGVKLDVHGNSAAVRVFESPSGADVRMVAGGSTGYLGTYNSNNLQILSGGATAIIANTSQNVGIGGAIAPDVRLHINGSNAYPATSGTTPTGFIALRNTTGATHGAYIGVANQAPWGTWIQAQDKNNLGTSYPILLNPNGGNVGIGTTNPQYKLEVNGSFAATTKSFIIPHPTKPGHKLRHGSLEGPENGVYVRGRSTETIISLPDYWAALIDPNSITITLTPIGPSGAPRVERIENNKVYIFSEDSRPLDYFYMVNAERVDVAPLEVEIPDTTNI